MLDEFASSVNDYLSSGSEQAVYTKQVDEYGKSVRASSDLGNRKRRYRALGELLDPIIEVDSSKASKSLIKPLQNGLFDEDENDENET